MSRKGYLLATAGSVAAVGATGAAQAAPPLPPAPMWTGFYLGLNAGMHWQHAGDTTSTPGYGTFADQLSAPGFIGGGQMGYNWQTGNVVFGLEGDIDGLTGKTRSATFFGNGRFNAKGYFSNSISWLSTVRGRVGIVAGDTFAYATGGAAFGGVQNAFNAIGNHTTKSESKTKTGWAAGFGLEHMLMNSHWIVGFEVLYVDLGSSQVHLPFKTTTFSNSTAIARFKVNYKF